MGSYCFSDQTIKMVSLVEVPFEAKFICNLDVDGYCSHLRRLCFLSCALFLLVKGWLQVDELKVLCCSL